MSEDTTAELVKCPSWCDTCFGTVPGGSAHFSKSVEVWLEHMEPVEHTVLGWTGVSQWATPAIDVTLMLKPRAIFPIFEFFVSGF